MANNTKTLIDRLRNGLCGRFSNIEVVNRDPRTGERAGGQGALSVVFRAWDEESRKTVALKFCDPDLLDWVRTPYRMALFEREARLLERLRGKRGLLQLVQPLSQVEITVTGDSLSVTVPCAYFAMEWLEGDIENYFLRQDEHDALVKLALFRRIVLGVFRLHRERIAHRDVKADNLRQVERRDEDPMVVPIDLGTAVDLGSTPIGRLSDYGEPVGANGFSPLEALVGLAAARGLAKASDTYALGCLLHDLFNLDYHFGRLWAEPGFRSCHGACWAEVSRLQMDKVNESEVIAGYRRMLVSTKGQVSLPTIESDEHTVPNAAREQLNRLLLMLTAVDYLQRESDVDRILRVLDRAVKCLRNAVLDGHRSQLRRQRRDRRGAKLREKQARLDAYLRELNDGVLPW